MHVSNTDNTWLTWLAVAQVLSWVVVIIGWYVTHNSNNQRERRKEIRSALDGLGEQLDTFIESAGKYYASTADSEEAAELAAKMRILQDRLMRHIPRVAKGDLEMDISPELNRLIDSATGGDFEGAKRKPRKPSDWFILNISSDAERVRGRLEDAFIDRYR